MGRSLTLEVPKKVFRRRSARLEAVFVRADTFGSLSRAVHLANVELFERGDGRGANSDGNVRGIAIEFENGGRDGVDSVRFGDNRRFELANKARRRNNFVADFFVSVYVAFPVLSRISIDIWHGSCSRTPRRHFFNNRHDVSGIWNTLAVYRSVFAYDFLCGGFKSVFADKNCSIARA